jgi:hypothetical protein
MSSLAGFGVLLLVLGVGAYFVYRSYAKMAGARLEKHIGLDAGESVAKLWVGQIDIDISVAESVSTAAAGLLAGALLGGIVTASVPAVTLLLTDRGRLVLITERPDGTANRVVFASPSELRVEPLGPGARRIQGGPSVMLELTPSDGSPLRILLHESARPGLGAWRNA